MSWEVKDLYAVLGVPPTASQVEITNAYEQLTQMGLGSEGDGLTPDRLREVHLAYAVLSDPSQRAQYDASAGRIEAGPTEPPAVQQPPPPTHTWNPIDRMTAGLPRGWRIVIDWVVTIAGAVAIVLAIKAWVVNPYRIPSSSMEPTLHCARPGPGCLAHFSDRVLANRFIYHFRNPHRGEIIVFKTPHDKNGNDLAEERCGAGGTFVKRLIGLPGETWAEKNGYVYINGKKLNEPYVKQDRRDSRTLAPRKIPKDHYFFMGDNRVQSCDSREWGTVPRSNLIGEVFAVYWPPNRIGFR
jgi:signal peptidase I